MRRRRNMELPAGSEMRYANVRSVKSALRAMGEDPSQFTDGQYKEAIKIAHRYTANAASLGVHLNTTMSAAYILLENEVKPSANPRRNGMARRRNGMRKNTSRDKNSNRAKARRKYQALSKDKNGHKRWYDDKQLFIAYHMEVKTNAKSPRSKAELREFAEEKWANRGR